MSFSIDIKDQGISITFESMKSVSPELISNLMSLFKPVAAAPVAVKRGRGRPRKTPK